MRTSSGRLVGRKLSAFERLSWKATPYASIAHWFQILGPTDPQGLAIAIREVYPRFAALQATIESNRLVLRPELKPEVTVDEVADVTPESLAQLGGEEASRGLGSSHEACEGRSLWRAKVLREGWVMLTFHHAIADAHSIELFIRELLEVLAVPDWKISHSDERHPPALSATLTTLLEQRGGGQVAGKAVGQLARLANSCKSPGRCSKQCPVTLREGREWPAPEDTADWQQRQTRACTATLGAASRLRAACRQRGVTVNAVLVASLACALRKRMSKSGKVSMQPILAFDTRRHIPDSDGLFGSYSLGGYGGKLKVGSDASLWDIAEQAKKLVQDVSSKSLAYTISWYMRFLTTAMGKQNMSWLNATLALNGPDQGRLNALLVSNTGLATGLSAAQFRVSEMFFISNQSAWGPFVWLNASTINDKLCLTLCYVEPLLSRSNAEFLLHQVLTSLEEAVQSAPQEQESEPEQSDNTLISVSL
mmetsp:Transcript_43848/g.71067  ORF Transcript_43848/g.71067 Transcript_43848/m.71067 type:complete len:479 (+) Transcript_43848:3-1439(+)